MRGPKRSRTHCSTKRLGAVSVSPPPSWRQASGCIQVTNCWGVSSRAKASRQAFQAAGVAILDMASWACFFGLW